MVCMILWVLFIKFVHYDFVVKGKIKEKLWSHYNFFAFKNFSFFNS